VKFLLKLLISDLPKPSGLPPSKPKPKVKVKKRPPSPKKKIKKTLKINQQWIRTGAVLLALMSLPSSQKVGVGRLPETKVVSKPIQSLSPEIAILKKPIEVEGAKVDSSPSSTPKFEVDDFHSQDFVDHINQLYRWVVMGEPIKQEKAVAYLNNLKAVEGGFFSSIMEAKNHMETGAVTRAIQFLVKNGNVSEPKSNDKISNNKGFEKILKAVLKNQNLTKDQITSVPKRDLDILLQCLKRSEEIIQNDERGKKVQERLVFYLNTDVPMPESDKNKTEMNLNPFFSDWSEVRNPGNKVGKPEKAKSDKSRGSR
jgi:hypothetical protein